MFDGPAAAAAVTAAGYTHVVWIPDSVLGRWDAALSAAPGLRLVRAAREGEALALAGGLLLGGAKPLVMVQITGLFEAGDALRNLVHDLNLPLHLVVGLRGHAAHAAGRTGDTCPLFAEPFVQLWQLPYTLVDPATHTDADFADALAKLAGSGGAGAVLLAE